MRRACIDIGSNTTRLLVADCDGGGALREHRQERAFTMLGRSIDATGAIPAAKLAEVLQAVAGQYAIARDLGAEQVRCVATAGVRRASNGAALAQLIGDACAGLELEILSDAEEARLAFIGAAWGIGVAGERRLGVVDAGGGSCELVVGDAPASVRWWTSVPLGSADVALDWLPSDPPTEAELERALRRAQAVFADVHPPRDVRRMIAVGGSATSLRMLVGPRLERATIDRLLAAAQRHSAAEFARSFGIDVQRARLLAGGLLILRVVSELFGVALEIGRGGLREGLLLEPDHQ